MGLYFRKSINLGGGVRLNFSKSGVGLSTGIKGARISTGPRGTYANFSIPGTGIRYTKKLSSTPSQSRTTNHVSSEGYPYIRTVTNSYTGQSRTVRAATQWELNTMVEAEELRMQNEELRLRQLEMTNNQRERAEEMTRQVQRIRESFENILAHTLNVNDKLDWNKQYIQEEYPEFSFAEKKPMKQEESKGFFSCFKRRNDNSSVYEKELEIYETHKKEALRDYIAKKEAFENNKRKHNTEITYLKNNFEKSEKSAVEKYISIILSNSEYPSELDMDFDVEYDKQEKLIIISFLMPEKENFPFVEKYKYSQISDEIIAQEMKKSTATAFYEQILYSICIRTIHEIYEAVYTNAVDRIVFNAYLLKNSINEEIDDFTDNVRCIFSVSTLRDDFINLDLHNANIEKIIRHLGINRTENFDTGEIQAVLN